MASVVCVAVLAVVEVEAKVSAAAEGGAAGGGVAEGAAEGGLVETSSERAVASLVGWQPR